jgi:hypothetical protein
VEISIDDTDGIPGHMISPEEVVRVAMARQ